MPVLAVPNVHRLTLALLAALALPAMAQEAPAQADAPAKAVKTLDRMQVTGSRIMRTEVEESLPITSFTKEEIEQQGITSAEQLMAYLNVASNGPDNLSSNAGIVQGTLRGDNGVSGANLRGQGADATLVLLNGRRVAPHGLKGRAVDLNSIPFAAIDRVEILRDGASAIYGTDAIGGVINFITKSDYQGLQASTFVDVTESGGGNIYRGNILFGQGDLERDGWNAFATLTVKRNEILRGNDREFSNSYFPEYGLTPDTRGTPFATVFNNTRSGSQGGPIPNLIGTGLLDPAGGTTRMAAINIYNLPGAEGCEAAGDAMSPYGYRIWNSASSKYACAWDYPAAAVIQQPQESVDFIGRATFKISERHQAYVEVMSAEVDVAKSFEANQITAAGNVTTDGAFGPETWYPLNAITQPTYDMIYDALAEYFGAGQLQYGQRIAYRWRCEACGPREIETNTKSYRVLAAVDGLIGDWNYNIGLSRSSSKSKSVLGTGYHYKDALNQLLGSGLLNPFLLPGQQQSAEAVAALAAASATGVTMYGGESVMTTFDASISGELGAFQLPGGAIAMAAGVDLRREEYQFDGDQREVRRVVFNAPFDDVNAMDNVSRDVKAVYAEFQLPVLKNFDLNLAGRYDDYSGFGGTTNPKVSFKYQPFEQLLFRGAYSTGFKVPNFNQLFTGTTESQYTGQDLADPASCPGAVANPNVAGCEIVRPVILTGGKPDLAPEESTQKSFGLVWSPMSQFSIALDWWEIERENSIVPANRADLIKYYDVFTSNWIRDANGNLVAIDQRFVNSGGSLTRGVEVDANLNGEVAGGRWSVHLNGSYLNMHKTKALETLPYTDNLVGKYVRYANLPIRWKHTLSSTYMRGNWTHTLTQIHRDGYFDEPPPSVANGSFIPTQWNPRVDGYTIYNYALTWTGLDKMKIAFGIKNLFNEDPPFTVHQNDYAAGAGWEPRIADPRGRAYTLLLEYSFW
jgi:iron complex outermembrane recepter protein